MRGKNYFRLSEACRRLGISPNTYRRYVEKGYIIDVGRDGRNWRVFTDEDIEERRRILINKGLVSAPSELKKDSDS